MNDIEEYYNELEKSIENARSHPAYLQEGAELDDTRILIPYELLLDLVNGEPTPFELIEHEGYDQDYEGMDFLFVIKRKSDNKLFAISYTLGYDEVETDLEAPSPNTAKVPCIPPRYEDHIEFHSVTCKTVNTKIYEGKYVYARI